MINPYEKPFINRLKKNPERYYFPTEKSVTEGFEYFESKVYKSKTTAVPSRLKAMLAADNTIWELIKLGVVFLFTVPSIFRNMARNFSDINKTHDLDEARESEPLEQKNNSLNTELWKDLQEYAWKKHKVIVGFTELPQDYIFTGKGVPFKYSLVFTQEMDKDEIEKAPKLDAGGEVIRVYNSLGIATNDIANWLREKQSIRCMANHPLGGLVDTVPLAQKAGLGLIGRSGCLITKEFGSRCRIALIFIKENLFEHTDTNDHAWISNFCKKCGACVRACPTSAIYSEPKLSQNYNEEIKSRYESYDREKCFTSFSAAMGCGICIAVCPFSKNPKMYDKLKGKYQITSQEDPLA